MGVVSLSTQVRQSGGVCRCRVSLFVDYSIASPNRDQVSMLSYPFSHISKKQSHFSLMASIKRLKFVHFLLLSALLLKLLSSHLLFYYCITPHSFILFCQCVHLFYILHCTLFLLPILSVCSSPFIHTSLYIIPSPSFASVFISSTNFIIPYSFTLF